MAARRAHFDTYAGLAEQIFHWFGGIKAADSFRQVIVDHKNLQAALEWGLEVQEIEAVSAVLSNLFILWLRAGYWQEGERLNASALAKKGKDVSVSRCLLLAQLGIFIVLQGRYSEAFPHVEQAYKLARRLEDPWCLAITLHIQGQAQSDQTKAMAAYDEVIDICQSHPEIPHCKSFLGGMLSLKGDRLVNFGLFAEAKASYEASLAQFRSLGETFQIAYPLGNLGRMALQDGQLQEAERLIAESTALTKRTGNRVGIADWSFRLGQVQFYLGNLALAEQNLQTALEMYEEIGQPFGPTGVLSMMSLVAIAQGRLSDAGSLIQNCFAEYRRLLAANQKVDFASDFLNFGDTIESLLYAGLVAHAQGDWQTALYFFSFCKNNTSNFEPVRPLQEKITAARTEIQNNLPRETFDTVLAQTETLTLDELLATSFDNSSSN
jgi:tetratricopeptide (TPR) repeat protein